jgi:hypothetical protein
MGEAKRTRKVGIRTASGVDVLADQIVKRSCLDAAVVSNVVCVTSRNGQR